MKEKWFIKKKHIVSFNLLAISCAMFFTGCNKHLDDVIIEEMPSTVNLSTTETTTTHVDCLFHRWYDEGDEYSYMNEEVCGFPFVDTICDKLFSYLWEQIKKGAFSAAGGFGNKIKDAYMDPFVSKEYQPSLNDLLNKLNDIQKSIESLNDAVKLSNYDGALREKETIYINLQTATLNAWRSLERIEKDSTISMEERIAMRKKIVKEWGDSNINGAGKGNFATINFAKKIMSVAAEQKSYYPIYDMYASIYFPFERQGWAWQANCRDRDVAILTIGFSLSHMYEVLNEGQFDKNALEETMKAFNEYIKANEVNRTSDKKGLNICNVPCMRGKIFTNQISLVPRFVSSGSDELINNVKGSFDGTPYVHALPYRYKNSSERNRSILGYMSNYQRAHRGCAYESNFGQPTVGEIMAIKDLFDKRGFKYKNLADILTQSGFVIEAAGEYKGTARLLADGAWRKNESVFNKNVIIGSEGVKLFDTNFENGQFRFGVIWGYGREGEGGDWIFKQWDTAPNPDDVYFNIYYCDKWIDM